MAIAPEALSFESGAWMRVRTLVETLSLNAANFSGGHSVLLLADAQ